SRGTQKWFLDYAEKVGRAWEASEAPFNEHWFRSVVAKAIAFRCDGRVVRLVSGGSRLQGSGGHQKKKSTLLILFWVLENREMFGTISSKRSGFTSRVWVTTHWSAQVDRLYIDSKVGEIWPIERAVT